MSFLRGRLNFNEGKYFKQESDLAASRLRDKLPLEPTVETSLNIQKATEDVADVLPEILQHRVPLSLRQDATVVKEPIVNRNFGTMQTFETDRVAREILKPVGHVPEVRLGRSKYMLDVPSNSQFVSSTANMRRKGNELDALKNKALMKGLGSVSKAFGVATILVYGGGVVAFLMTCKAIGAGSLEDIPVKVQERMHPFRQKIQERFSPIREKVLLWSESFKLSESKTAVGTKFGEYLGVSQKKQQ